MMFLGTWKDENGNRQSGLYYDFEAFHRDTFAPSCKDIEILAFKVSGKTYAERKAAARDLAIDWQLNFNDVVMYFSEYAAITSYFEKIGKRYGLLTEFRENCIC